MKSKLFLTLGTLIGLACLVQAQEEHRLRALIRKAIEAHGGDQNLVKTARGKLKAEATGNFPGKVSFQITWTEIFDLPQRYKRVIEGQMNGERFTMEYAIVEGKGWIRLNDGEVKDVDVPMSTIERNWTLVLASLPGLLGEDWDVSPLATEKVNGRDAVGVRVQSQEETADAYFDAKHGFFVKRRGMFEHPFLGEKAESEVFFGDFKEVSGVKYPMEITVHLAGQKVMQLKLLNFELLETIDAQEFARPRNLKKAIWVIGLVFGSLAVLLFAGTLRRTAASLYDRWRPKSMAMASGVRRTRVWKTAVVIILGLVLLFVFMSFRLRL